jgi:DNA-binding MarR family transcriptional regulator
MSNREKSPFAVKSYAGLAEDSGFLMLQVSSLWALYHDKALKKYYDLTHMQYAVLASVYWLTLHSEKEVTQIILAQHTKINTMTISHMLKVLEARGYVFRTTHSTDVRAKVINLTEEGKALLDKAIKTILDVDAKFFRVLGKNIKHFNRYMFELLNDNE